LNQGPFRRVFAVVADGMGGASKGEIASFLASRSMAESFLCSLPGKRLDKEDYCERLKESFLKAHQVVLQKENSAPEYKGMGTTASAVFLEENELAIAHIGDTRVYVIEPNKIEQITKDHSYVQELVDRGMIPAEAARTHPNKNVITKAIGYDDTFGVDIYSKTLQEGSYVLVCCDGLVNELSDKEIMDKVLSSSNLSSACDDLIKSANTNGGKDNISVVIIGPVAESQLKKPQDSVVTADKRKRRAPWHATPPFAMNADLDSMPLVSVLPATRRGPNEMIELNLLEKPRRAVKYFAGTAVSQSAWE